MSMASESPVNSSSSDDFAALIDTELEAASSNASFDYEEEAVDDNDTDDDDEDVDYDSATSKRQKVEGNIEMLHESTSLPEMQQKLDASSIKEEVCTHPEFVKELCTRCGQRVVHVGAAVAFRYIHKDLKIGTEEAARLRGKDLKNLLRNKKLCLVLDLDHTLLNSTLFLDISPEEEYPVNSLRNPSGGLFKLDSIHMLTKLRPFVQTFLKEASSMFEMYIYTMGERAYALEMARILDPEGVYFPSRVISRDDCTQKHQKSLDVVLGADNAVLILDDTEMVWQKKHIENLIVMDRYHFFSGSGLGLPFGFKCKSLSEKKMDESETDGALATVLQVLKEVHRRFFDPQHVSNVESRDVRQFLKSIRKEVLKGCTLVFTHVWKKGVRDQDQKLWLMAEQLGATCVQQLDESVVTHVVSLDPGTDKSRWAVEHKKFLVHPGWIEAANFLWKRHPEEDFKMQRPGHHHC